jgi:hypothetical protein
MGTDGYEFDHLNVHQIFQSSTDMSFLRHETDLEMSFDIAKKH